MGFPDDISNAGARGLSRRQRWIGYAAGGGLGLALALIVLALLAIAIR